MKHVDLERLSRDELLAHAYALQAQLGATARDADTIATLCVKFGLTEHEGRILVVLADGRAHSKGNIIQFVYPADNEPDSITVGVFLHRLRHKLAPFGVRVKNIRSVGYYLENADVVRAAMGGAD